MKILLKNRKKVFLGKMVRRARKAGGAAFKAEIKKLKREFADLKTATLTEALCSEEPVVRISDSTTQISELPDVLHVCTN